MQRQKKGLVTTFGHSRWNRSLSLTDVTWMLIPFLRGFIQQDSCACCWPFNYFLKEEVNKAVMGRFEFFFFSFEVASELSLLHVGI